MGTNLHDGLLGEAATILVVENRPDLLKLIQEGLEEFGFKVISSSDASAAVHVSEDYQGVIHLLLTDVIMPGMSGKNLSDEIVKKRPTIKTLYMSGYTQDVLAPHGVLDEGIHFLHKPFTFDELHNKVRYILSLD